MRLLKRLQAQHLTLLRPSNFARPDPFKRHGSAVAFCFWRRDAVNALRRVWACVNP